MNNTQLAVLFVFGVLIGFVLAVIVLSTPIIFVVVISLLCFIFGFGFDKFKIKDRIIDLFQIIKQKIKK
jgi:hypothetical protein